MENRKPSLVVFAGPNGSGKSTITKCFPNLSNYTNADDIKKAIGCSDMGATIKADEIRMSLLMNLKDLSFETVLFSDYKFDIIEKAKSLGYFIKSYFVLTDNYNINISRVDNRVDSGGHSVPVDKIVSRYSKSIENLPRLLRLSDICNVYDNTNKLYRIFSKKSSSYRVWENTYWNYKRTLKLVNCSDEEVIFL